MLEKNEKMFSPKYKFSQIDPNNFTDLIEKFEDRMNGWYFNPANILLKNKHTGFPVMAIACIIVDTLAGYFKGLERDTEESDFIEFLREKIPELHTELPLECQNKYPNLRKKDYAYAIYKAFRCGILHEARIKHYGAISEENVELIKYDAKSGWILINPRNLVAKLEEVFNEYIKNLKNGENAQLVKNFKKRFYHLFKKEIDLKSFKSL